MRRDRIGSLVIILFIVGCSYATARADWERETGVKAGYDSNLDRAISNPQGSGYLSGFLSLNREAGGESRFDWSLGTQVEGTAYFNLAELNSAAVTLAPGLTYFLHKDWLISVSLFGQAKSVVDSEQSALAFGGKINLKQRWKDGIYSGQYYLYRDSRAQVDTYSYIENALGVFLGWKWSAKLFSEIGYEFSRGDSFLTVDHQAPSGSQGGPGDGSGGGSGRDGDQGTNRGGDQGSNRGGNPGANQEKGPRFSSAFNASVVRELVNRHTMGVTLGYDWNKMLYSLAGYVYTLLQGDSGDASNHGVFITLGYRF
jgi:hypothetical protein